MKKLAYLIIASLLLPVFTGRAGATVRLISSDANSAVIEYRTAEPEFTAVGNGDVALRLTDAQIYGKTGEPGLLECLVNLAVPENSRVVVEVISTESKEYAGIKLAPVPAVALDKDGIDHEVFKADARAYAVKSYLPADLALVESVAPLRQLTVARVSLRPAQYAPVSGTLRVFTSLQVKVTWSGGMTDGAVIDDKSFEPVLERLVLNFAAARNWGKRDARGAAKQGDPFAASRLWYKLSVARDGIYRLSYTDLKLNGINPDIIDPRTLKLFSGGSSAFPKSYADPYPDSMFQVALRVEGEADGSFGPDDYILFYGRGMNGWNQNRLLPNNQYNNPYDSVNCYWLCWGGEPGLRMAVRNGEPVTTGAPVPAAFTDTLHFEQDRINPFNSGELWYWQNMPRYSYEQTKRFSLPFVIPALAADQAQLRVNLLAGTTAYNHHLRWGINGNAAKDYTWSGSPTVGQRTDQTPFGGIVAGGNSLEIDLIKQGSDSADAVLLNWFEVICRRTYQAFNRQLAFRADSAYAGAALFHVTGLATDRAVILDITNPDKPAFIATTRRFPGFTEFEEVPLGKKYFIAAPEAWVTPAAVRPYYPQNLRQSMLNTKYLLIAADEFWLQAQALISYHATQAKRQPARAVKLSAVYDEFGFGIKDPSVVRNFLKYVYLNSTPARTSPAWVCLLGDGSYDYRWIDRGVPDQNLVPTHQEDIIDYVLKEYLCSANDDWFAYIDSMRYPQFVMGRIPAKDVTEAWNAVSKAVNYNQRQSLGSWRNKCLLMADDAYERAEPNGETIHTQQSEDLLAHIPAAYDRIKVYGEMREYTLSAQLTKPGAQADLIRYWNDGVGIVNFIGHGAWWTWGHEQYFQYSDVPGLNNGDRLPLVVMASCGTSRFDNSHNDAIGSALVVKQGGGAIATIGAMRESAGTNNSILVDSIYSGLFSPTMLDIGQAIYTAKCRTNNPNNNASYVLLGDPATQLGQPHGMITLALNDSILLSRGRYELIGKISGDGAPTGGQAVVSIFDVSVTDSSDTYHNLKYSRPGKLIFKGMAAVTGDSFRTIFNVPDLLDSIPVSGARISAYAWNGPADAAGATTGAIRIGGADTTRPNDYRGPQIVVSVNGLPIAEGETIDPAAQIVVRISDPLGINIAPGLPEGEIRIRFDGGDYKDLSQQFLYEAGSDSSGTVTVAKTFHSSASDTIHTIRVEAYDCLLNKSVWERSIKVGSAELMLESVFNYPNPFREQTWFTFKVRQPADVNIKVYTVAGRLIKTIEAPALAAGYNQVPWNGRDGDGDPLANGVYIYKIAAKNSGGETSAFGRLTVMR